MTVHSLLNHDYEIKNLDQNRIGASDRNTDRHIDMSNL